MGSLDRARRLTCTWVALGALQVALAGCAAGSAGRREPASGLDAAPRASDAGEQAPATARRVVVLDEVVLEDAEGAAVSPVEEARRSYEPSYEQREVAPRLRRAHPALMRCYADQLRHEPELRGRVSVELRIATSGSVTARVVENTTNSRALADCIANHLRQLRFDAAPPLEPIALTLPFHFLP